MIFIKRTIFLIFLGVVSVVSSGHLPEPTSNEIKKSCEEVAQKGKEEVFSLSFPVLNQFLWDRYILGPQSSFNYYGSNPQKISFEQAQRPAVLFVHASQSNQGEWLPFLHTLQDEVPFEVSSHVFTFNFDDEMVDQKLCQKIEAIRDLYLDAGADEVTIHLVGHSLGAIAAVKYAYDQESWVADSKVGKVISIAGRLKNLSEPTQTPFYPYCYDTLSELDPLYEQIEKKRGLVELYTIAGEEDWLVPKESVLVGDYQAVIPNKGHIFVACAHATRDQVIEWLYPKD